MARLPGNHCLWPENRSTSLNNFHVYQCHKMRLQHLYVICDLHFQGAGTLVDLRPLSDALYPPNRLPCWGPMNLKFADECSYGYRVPQSDITKIFAIIDGLHPKEEQASRTDAAAVSKSQQPEPATYRVRISLPVKNFEKGPVLAAPMHHNNQNPYAGGGTNGYLSPWSNQQSNQLPNAGLVRNVRIDLEGKMLASTFQQAIIRISKSVHQDIVSRQLGLFPYTSSAPWTRKADVLKVKVAEDRPDDEASQYPAEYRLKAEIGIEEHPSGPSRAVVNIFRQEIYDYRRPTEDGPEKPYLFYKEEGTVEGWPSSRHAAVSMFNSRDVIKH